MTHSWFPTLALAVQPISTTSDSQVAHTQDYQGAFEPDWAIKENSVCLLLALPKAFLVTCEISMRTMIRLAGYG